MIINRLNYLFEELIIQTGYLIFKYHHFTREYFLFLPEDNVSCEKKGNRDVIS